MPYSLAFRSKYSVSNTVYISFKYVWVVLMYAIVSAL